MLIYNGESRFNLIYLLKISLLILPFTIYACSEMGGEDASTPAFLMRPWELSIFIDKDDHELDLYDYEVHTLRFKSESEFMGEAACNNFEGTYQANKRGKIKITQIYVTEALCRQPSTGEEFVDAITNIKKFTIDEGRLVLGYGENGQLIFLERLE